MSDIHYMTRMRERAGRKREGVAILKRSSLNLDWFTIKEDDGKLFMACHHELERIENEDSK